MSILIPPGYEYPKEFRKMDKLNNLLYGIIILLVVLVVVIILIAMSL